MQTSDKIYVAGHNGMVGSAIVRLLKQQGYNNLLLRTSTELDLKDTKMVSSFFKQEKPSYVFLAAAKVGGIFANKLFKADFIYENLMIQNNVIHQSYKNGVKKLLFLGSSCIYPKLAQQPIKEDYLMTGSLEEANDAYAIAKIAGIKMCEAYREQYDCNFICAMPTNLYGPNDSYDLTKSQVLPALLKKIITVKQQGKNKVMVWGTGNQRREFLHVDDLASACLFLMSYYNRSEIINIGVGSDVSIIELAELIKKIVGFDGVFKFDTTKPDNISRKLLDISRIHSLGWRHSIDLEDGLAGTYADYLNTYPVKTDNYAFKIN